MLAEAVCKLEGFRYAPDPSAFWNHGHSTERDHIYVTTQTLSAEQLQYLSDQVGPDRTLLVCCTAFRATADFPHLTVKKIPRTLLDRCAWGRDDYSLPGTGSDGSVDGAAPDPIAEDDGSATEAGRRVSGGAA
jgi:adenine-specific DNA-methyltransferase